MVPDTQEPPVIFSLSQGKIPHLKFLFKLCFKAYKHDPCNFQGKWGFVFSLLPTCPAGRLVRQAYSLPGMVSHPIAKALRIAAQD
jgi:hypothetical protein